MAPNISEYDVVALIADLPELGLVKGQVGAVVMAFSPECVEVEFVDVNGKTYALTPIPTKQLMQLHYHRVQAA